MPNTIKTISLTDDDKSYLNKLLTQSTLEIRVYQCARILLLKSEGASKEASTLFSLNLLRQRFTTPIPISSLSAIASLDAPSDLSRRILAH